MSVFEVYLDIMIYFFLWKNFPLMETFSFQKLTYNFIDIHLMSVVDDL